MEALDNPSYFRVMGAATSQTAHAPCSASARAPEGRRSFRSLLRSLSAHERVPQQMLVRGEPRPADKEPAQNDRHAHSAQHRAATQPRRRSAHHHLLGTADMVYCATPRGACVAPVLPGGGESRYYNLTMPLAGASRRRHSIGAFLKSTSAPKALSLAGPAVEGTVAGSRTQGTQPRSARHVRGATGEKSCDVVVISSRESQAAATWVQYLHSCFDAISKQKKRRPYRVLTQNLETLDSASASQARLQVVVVCPALLAALSERPRALCDVIAEDRALAMLLGVAEDALTARDKAALSGWSNWARSEVMDQDVTNVRAFLDHAVGILDATSRRSRPAFALAPKKVKEGSSKVLILLDSAVTATDIVTVTVESGGSLHAVPVVKQRNPFTIGFVVPPACLAVSNLAVVAVTINGAPIGKRQIKCESRMRELEQMLRSVDNPLQLMCQTLGFNDREQLDGFLVAAFQRNLPPHFNLLHSPHTPTRSATGGESLPTLLHFAAAHGLERLAWQLLECPGGEAACDLRNGADLTPGDLAEQAGHSRLAGQLKGFTQMNEFSNMYSYMRVMSEGANAENLSAASPALRPEAEYCSPRPLSQTYQVPRFLPLAVPLAERFPPLGSSLDGRCARSPMGDYQMPRSVDEDYQLPRCSEDDYQVPPAPRAYTPNHYMQMNAKLAHQEAAPTFDIGPLAAFDKALREEGRGGASPRGCDDELADIITDFKNQVVSIAEVERLVASWENRHSTQQSFKDKQEQLAAMREEYERLQTQLKATGKAATPFDRIRRFFRGPKSKGESVVKEEAVCKSVRPGSSLSLHSVCSSTDSGRMSTVSASSLGDSGTHSDPEDRARHRSLAVPSFYAPDVPSIQERPPCPVPRPPLPEDVDYIEPDYVAPPTNQQPPSPPPANQKPSFRSSANEEPAEYLGLEEPEEEPMPEYMNLSLPMLPPRR